LAKSRQELLKLAARKYQEVDGVRLQSLTELERSNLQSSWGERFDNDDDDAFDRSAMFAMRRELLVACIVDDNGDRIFQMEEADLIGQWDAAFVAKLHDAAHILCGFSDPEVDIKKSEETEG
jgi:hypothetical protein